MANEIWTREIHKRLLKGDPIAPAELAEGVYGKLIDRLAFRYRNPQHRDLIADAVADALMAYIKHPDRFLPSKRSLMGFLTMAAEGDLKNALAKTKRQKNREIPLEPVELGANDGNEISRTEDPDLQIDGARLREHIHDLFDDPTDRAMIDLMIEGERSTRAFAEVLHIENLPEQTQRAAVKRHKDRLKKRIQRHGKGLLDNA